MFGKYATSCLDYFLSRSKKSTGFFGGVVGAVGGTGLVGSTGLMGGGVMGFTGAGVGVGAGVVLLLESVPLPSPSRIAEDAFLAMMLKLDVVWKR